MAAEQTAQAEAAQHAADLATLAVADAARREWREANAAKEAAAREADAELRRRGIEERIPVTDAEVAEAAAQARETPAIDPAERARWKAEQTAQVEADRQARAEAIGPAIPVTDAEIAKYGAAAQAEPEAEAAEVGHDQGAELGGIREEIEAVSAKADQLAEQDAQRDAERRAEMDEAGIDEPVVHEPQAEPQLEPSWQAGDAQGQYEPQPESDYEAEIG